MEKDPMQDFYDEMEGKKLLELAEIMNNTRVKLDAAKAVKTGLQKEYDALRLNLVPSAMDDDDISSVTIDGIGRLGLTADIYASIPAEHRNEAWEWLRRNGLGDIIRPTINAGTLKATLKSLIKGGKLEVPENLFKITPFSRASITKR